MAGMIPQVHEVLATDVLDFGEFFVTGSAPRDAVRIVRQRYNGSRIVRESVDDWL